MDPKGDALAFDRNWQRREEAAYLHWTRYQQPNNQVQLAFRRHWQTFSRLIQGREGQRRCLEVGCGRGSLSAYFADAGWDCSLLDLSPTAIARAQQAFAGAGLQARFDIGDCLSLPYANHSFDLVFSIGLLEHFQAIETVLAEQARVLAPGGTLMAYVVPEFTHNLQKDFHWVNELLQALLPEASAEAKSDKAEVYRSDALSPPYLAVLRDLGLQDCQASGIYSLPMISHSVDFPFSLLPGAAEKVLVNNFQRWLDEREAAGQADAWLCEEGWGQAFLVWGNKPQAGGAQ